jgi:hypothetical protein
MWYCDEFCVVFFVVLVVCCLVCTVHMFAVICAMAICHRQWSSFYFMVFPLLLQSWSHTGNPGNTCIPNQVCTCVFCVQLSSKYIVVLTLHCLVRWFVQVRPVLDTANTATYCHGDCSGRLHWPRVLSDWAGDERLPLQELSSHVRGHPDLYLPQGHWLGCTRD